MQSHNPKIEIGARPIRRLPASRQREVAAAPSIIVLDFGVNSGCVKMREVSGWDRGNSPDRASDGRTTVSPLSSATKPETLAEWFALGDCDPDDDNRKGVTITAARTSHHAA
jgi:hypothetical protein